MISILLAFMGWKAVNRALNNFTQQQTYGEVKRP